MPIITLTSDFGFNDHYVGVMKGVILSIAPEASIVDINHNIEFANVMAASFSLEVSHKYFPDGTIHVVVVDPGVGGERRAIGLKTAKGIFIGPDNGCFTGIINDYPIIEIRSIDNRRIMLEDISHTFHGRDIFAPAAAHLAKGLDFTEIGPKIDNPVKSPIKRFELKENLINAHVIHIDRFGNLITNIPSDFRSFELLGKLKLKLQGNQTVKAVKNFESLEKGKLGIIPGSSGYYEIVMNRGSAASRINASVGDSLAIEIPGSC